MVVKIVHLLVQTDLLVVGENMGPSKLEKAQKWKIEMVSENDFLALIGIKNSDQDQIIEGQGSEEFLF